MSRLMILMALAASLVVASPAMACEGCSEKKKAEVEAAAQAQAEDAQAAAESEAAEQPVAQVGQPAPAFSLQDIEGKTHELGDYKGKIVVLHFQGKDCPWDQAYQPHLNEMAQEYGAVEGEQASEDAEVVFLAINANQGEEAAQLQTYHREKDMPYPILKDEGNKVADLYTARTTPHMYVIDKEGVLRYMGGVETVPVALSDVGQGDEQYVEAVLESLVNGQKPAYTETQSKGCSIKRAAS